eukprot:tig00000194_g14816.t1
MCGPRLLLALLVAACTALAPGAQGCSCFAPATLTASYYASSHVFVADILAARPAPPDATDLDFDARVVELYKGPTSPALKGRRVTVTTSASSAACGVELKAGKPYLLSASAASPFVFRVELCQVNVPAEFVSPCGWTYLRSRSVCNGTAEECGYSTDSAACTAPGCLRACAVLPPANCVADPCEQAQECRDPVPTPAAPAPSDLEGAAVCEGNPCGACRAERYGPAPARAPLCSGQWLGCRLGSGLLEAPAPGGGPFSASAPAPRPSSTYVQLCEIAS